METGVLVWKERPRSHFPTNRGWESFNGRLSGSIAGHSERKSKGVYVLIMGKAYAAHRIVWAMVNGDPGDFQIDHIDRNPLNNCPSNLRIATHSENARNCSGKKSSLGIKGVYMNTNGGLYCAKIRVNGKGMHLGSFPSKGLAAVAYAKASIKYHGRFAFFGQKFDKFLRK